MLFSGPDTDNNRLDGGAAVPRLGVEILYDRASTIASSMVPYSGFQNSGTVDDRHSACPYLYYSALIPRVLVYKVMQDVYHQP